MKIKLLPITSAILTSLLLPLTTIAAAANHIVISEVKHNGSGLDEFVELYNPTSQVVSLSGWKLTRKNSGGTEANLVSSFPEASAIPAHGFFLITNPSVEATYSADLVYSAPSNSLTNNYTVLLYNDATESAELIDKVGLGTATDFEASASANPTINQSVERKAKSSSTAESMLALDADQGNGEDTDNNSQDFIIRETPQPQNSSSSAELLSTPTPTPTPSPTPTQVPKIVMPTPTHRSFFTSGQIAQLIMMIIVSGITIIIKTNSGYT